ncbi:ankyrin repeat domain-containing protein [Wolbachia endosymbiont (group B) of Ischnura elegans]|uniref:ankyrin repeat domain-containing protein n=1 Tax=Wolbachia endosymbiont (group B) of Ischnura elegans TaxID=2954021 RepID=UPI00222F99A7|nr:ankyrin repeat domain-containing protein [Wolbachia endosymbiont (group B) of Ischnura elegans]
MTGEYESLEKVLRTIEAEKDLNLNNIIEKIKTELEEQDQGLYKEWEKGAFDVNHGFSLNISGIEYSKFPLLIIAARNGYTKTVGVLLGVGADINEKDSFSCTALCHAALCGRKEIVEFLISKEADVNAKGSFGCTVLHNAALCGCKEIVEFLTSKGADVNAKDIFNCTALHYAALYGRKEVVEFLTSKGADVNAKNIFNCTALHYAAFNDHTKIKEALFGRGADFDVDEPLFLHNDAKNGCVGIVGILLGKGARVNAVDLFKKTPLDYAKNQDLVKALLDAGGRSFVEEHNNKAMIAGGVNTLLGTAIAVALFTTGTITAQLIPIVIAVVVVTAAALVVGCATYARSKPSTKVDGAEKPIVNSINEQQGVTGISS